MKQVTQFTKLSDTSSSLADQQNGQICPICNTSRDKFEDFGVFKRANALCPCCKSLERHRLVWLFLQQKTNLFAGTPLSFLHFAPERCLREQLSQLKHLIYVTSDIQSHKAEITADITDLPFEDNSFDIIYCSHILEHIEKDRRAMREIRRVLAPGGAAAIMVPINEELEVTQEEPSINTPELRQIHYGNKDHVRYYGKDFGDRLKNEGFDVSEENFIDEFSEEDKTKFGLRKELIYLCLKPINC